MDTANPNVLYRIFCVICSMDNNPYRNGHLIKSRAIRFSIYELDFPHNNNNLYVYKCVVGWHFNFLSGIQFNKFKLNIRNNLIGILY